MHNLITENNYLISNLEEIMPYLKENSSLKETKDTIELIRKLKTNEAF